MENLRAMARANLGGHFEVECYRKGELIWTERMHNVWTSEGLDSLLNVYLHAATQITTWYCLIFESDTTPAAGTTYAAPVFTESTAYDEATRPEYVEAASSSQSVTNSANKAVFTISATKTIYGAALVGGGTAPTVKGDTTSGGTMPVAGKFTASRAVVDNDVLNLTYTVGAADDGA